MSWSCSIEAAQELEIAPRRRNIRAGGVEKDVTIENADEVMDDEVDAA